VSAHCRGNNASSTCQRRRRLPSLATAVGALATRPDGEFFDAMTPVDDDGDSKAEEPINLMIGSLGHLDHDVAEHR